MGLNILFHYPISTRMPAPGKPAGSISDGNIRPGIETNKPILMAGL
jgi:hypothetical protein